MPTNDTTPTRDGRRLIFKWFLIVVVGMLALGVVVAVLAYSYSYLTSP